MKTTTRVVKLILSSVKCCPVRRSLQKRIEVMTTMPIPQLVEWRVVHIKRNTFKNERGGANQGRNDVHCRRAVRMLPISPEKNACYLENSQWKPIQRTVEVILGAIHLVWMLECNL